MMQEKEVAEQQVADMAQDVERARQRADIEHERNSGQGKELDAAKKVSSAFVYEPHVRTNTLKYLYICEDIRSKRAIPYEQSSKADNSNIETKHLVIQR